MLFQNSNLKNHLKIDLEHFQKKFLIEYLYLLLNLFLHNLLKKMDLSYHLYKYLLLENLHMLDNGATGTWEHWNARRSRLHNCFNGIGSWFYQALGGIIPDTPGYRHVRIAPQIPEGLESVKVSQRTPYGDIIVSRNGRDLHFELPVGVTATVAGKKYSCGKYDIEL